MKQLTTYGRRSLFNKIKSLFKVRTGYINIPHTINLQGLDRSEEEY